MTARTRHRTVAVAATATACLLVLTSIVGPKTGVQAQLAWTSIYVDGTSQIDLWTSSSKGCQCPWESEDDGGNKADLSCACCVKDGGCHCGTASPNRCMQCGLEEHCNNMCNMTIDSMTLLKQSGKIFGQIKSRVLEGPGLCWYSFVPSAGQRVEIQLYRLVSIGRFNGTSCENGALRVYMGGSNGDRSVAPASSRAIDEIVRSPATFEMCGVNERYSPPVVLFSDSEEATTLVFGVEEKTLRSQFLAYFSFTAATASSPQQQQLAFQPYGGTRLHNTVCDWLYQDFSCRKHPEKPCVMASPGYPGLYPSNRICNYHITTSSVTTRVRLSIRFLMLPHGRCDTDYLAVYQGSAKSTAQHLHTFCGNNAVTSQGGSRKTRDQTTHYEYSGPNLLIEFGSGPARPPFNYNGFLIDLHFVEQAEGEGEGSSTAAVEVMPPAEPSPQPSFPISGHRSGGSSSQTPRGNCNVIIRANETQSGHFDTRSHDWSHICRITFVGRSSDVVHVSLFNYNLRSRSCNTVIEVWDGMAPHDAAANSRRTSTRKPIHKICSPETRHARDRGGSFLEHQTFVSSGSTLTLIVKRTAAAHLQSVSENYMEFVDGAYLFHDERLSGTLQPNTMCEVSFYGLSSNSSGNVTNPGSEHLYWNVEGELRCSQHFVPAANQSVTLSINSVGSSTSISSVSSKLQGASPLLNELVPPYTSAACEMRCGDGGCECASDPRTKRPHDKLEIFTDHSRTSLVCLCGDRFDPFMLPVTVHSWTQLTLVYTVASYSWNTKGFDYAASYNFERDSTCGVTTIMKQSGEIVSDERTGLTSLDSAAIDRPNTFYHQSCVWILDSNVERQLYVELSSNQSRSCAAWNISLHEYSPSATDVGNAGVGELLHTFCSREKHKSYSLPWKLNTVVVRLRLMSRTPAQYKIKWRSQVVRANTRLANPTPAPNSASTASRLRYAVHSTVKLITLSIMIVAVSTL